MNKLIYLLFFFTSMAFAILAVFIFVPVSQFPAPDGPYGVGYVKYHWIDKARQELNVQDPEHPNRELMAYVFYPTDKNHQGERVGYNSDQINGYIGLMSYTSGFPAWLFGGVYFLKTHSQLNVPIAKVDSKFPVVIVSHGWGAQLHGWTWFCELLASNGYFVVGISHPYVAEITRYLDNRVVKTLVFKKAAERKQEGGEERYRSWKADQVEICAQDMSSVITKLEELNVQGSEFWSGKIDLNKIGVMGGSFGGTTSVRACRKDSRISCGIDMDGCLRGDDVTAKLLKPFMIMLAEQSNQWVDDRGIKDLDNINAFINRSENNIEKVTFKNLGHAAFSDAPIILNSTLFTRIFSRYFDFIGTSNPAEAPSVGTLCRELKKMDPCIVDFFDRTLKASPTRTKD